MNGTRMIVVKSQIATPGILTTKLFEFTIWKAIKAAVSLHVFL